ncbi:hypothetical protein ACVWY5_001128 [Bradyrhizobium sp. USDA 3256]
MAALASSTQPALSMTWDRFQHYVGRYIPKVRACHPHPNPRYAP